MSLNLKFKDMTTTSGAWRAPTFPVTGEQARLACENWLANGATRTGGLMTELAKATGYSRDECLRGADKLAQKLRRAGVIEWDKAKREWRIL